MYIYVEVYGGVTQDIQHFLDPQEVREFLAEWLQQAEFDSLEQANETENYNLTVWHKYGDGSTFADVTSEYNDVRPGVFRTEVFS